ncbi:MAG: hypothetical protein J6X55_17490 [Victivallales bacterium]|nr:hypothetical protein [Victivallales bacterium]
MKHLLLSLLLTLSLLPVLADQTVFQTSLSDTPEAMKAAGWTVPASGVTSVDDVLQIEATGGERNYLLYYVPVEKGAMYGGSIKVKPMGVERRNNFDRGATVFFGFADRTKGWVAGGEFPRGGYDTGDWQTVTIGMTQPIPDNVAFIEIWVCVEGQGKAQFKDIEVHKTDLTTNWKVDASVNPPVFSFDSPDFLFKARVPCVLRITVSQDPSFPENASFAEMVHTKDTFTFPFTLTPGKWYAKGNWCSRGTYPPMNAEFTLPALPQDITYKVTPKFANGTYREKPELTFGFYPQLPKTVSATINGNALTITKKTGNEITFTPTAPLPKGTYDIIITAEGKESTHILVNKNPAHKYAFRDDNMLLIDNEPFFPIGTYRDPSDDKTNFDGIHEAGFNVTHCYDFESKRDDSAIVKYLDDCRKNNVYAFMGISRNALKADDHLELQKTAAAMYDQPALLSIYLADEPELWINQHSMKNGADAVKAACPNVPRILLLCQPNETAPVIKFLGDGLSEIFWHDPYPIPNSPITDVKRTLEAMRRICKNKQSLWCVVQAFDWKQVSVRGMKYEDVEPKAGKIRCMTHLALAANVQGIIYYWLPSSRYDMRRDSPIQWAETVTCARELRTLYPFLIGRNAPQKDLKLPEGVDYWCRQASDGRYALGLINTTEKAIEFEVKALSFEQKINLRPYGVEVLK